MSFLDYFKCAKENIHYRKAREHGGPLRRERSRRDGCLLRNEGSGYRQIDVERIIHKLIDRERIIDCEWGCSIRDSSELLF
jgi:hypothetical protein